MKDPHDTNEHAVPPAAARVDRADRPDACADGDATVLDPAALQRLRSFGAPGSDEIVRRIVSLYLTATPPDIVRLLSAIEQRDWATTRDVAHKLKSSAATLGAAGFSAMLLQLEHDVSGQAPAISADFVRSLQDTYDRVRGALQREIA
jgi:HPt (histidine-containing phosphotransfer) domain-containing protein